jgi:hypothetical protein
MKVHVPLHTTPDWIGTEVSRRFHEGDTGRPARRTTYIRPKTISIRQHIALAEKLKKNHESI